MKFYIPLTVFFLGMPQLGVGQNQNDQEDRQMLSSIIDLADQLQNAIPTAPTTPFPTEEPTVSPAPSPRPSSTPTETPTVSQAPSVSPTNYPTVSHQPTNHPTVSSKPSASPSVSPTDVPSASPTLNPTLSPTVSSKPSSRPSVSPTDVPSVSPSFSPTDRPSVMPSDRPSSVPTVSSAPTLIYYATLRANTFVYLEGIDKTMNAMQIDAFEEMTKFFIQQTLKIEGAVLVTSVAMLQQDVVKLEDAEHGHKHNHLQVEIRVVAEYESLVHPDDFNFEHALTHTLEVNETLYKTTLLEESNDPYYQALIPHHHDNDGGITKGGYIAVIVCSIIVSILAILASYYAIKRAKDESQKGDKLSEVNMYNDGVDSDISEDVGVGLQGSKSIEIIQVSDSPDEAERDVDENNNNNNNNNADKGQKPVTPNGSIEVDTFAKNHPSAMKQQVMSPNTMENGSRLGALAESILRSESFGSNRDPPESSGYKYAPKVSKGDPTANYRAAPFGVPRPDTTQPPSKREEFNQRKAPTRRDPSIAGASPFAGSVINSFFPQKKEPEQRDARNTREVSPSPAPERPRFDPASNDQAAGFNWPNDQSNNNNNNTRSSRNGKFGSPQIGALGGKNDPNTSPSSSAVSSSINAFLNMVGGTLGAAPLASPVPQPKDEKKVEKNEKFHDILQREGLYDVLAPGGALGIVVDTTKDGPAVHSLKQTSPMLGLINPGDLIVGLDSQDTRSMTAATLTRLMAQKSNQKERKITLLAADNY